MKHVMARVAAASELDDAFRSIRLAGSVGSHTLDDLKSLRAVSRRGFVPKLQRDVLNEVGRVIEAGGDGRSDLWREGRQSRQHSK
jgi:hypothetical protein